MLLGVGLFWGVWRLSRSGLDPKRAYWLGLGLVGLLAIVSVLCLPMLNDDYIRFNGFSSGFIDVTRHLLPRLDWLSMHRNTLAGMLDVFIPLALAYTFCGQGRAERVLALSAALTMFVALLVVNSRGGLVSFGVGLAVLTWLGWRYFRPAVRRWVQITSLVVVLIAGIYLAGSGQYRLFSPERLLNENGHSRLEIWQNTFNLLADHPLTGLGPGQFQPLYSFYVDHSSLANRDSQEHAHNILLQSYVEAGLPGALGVIGVIGSWFLLGRKIRKGGLLKELDQSSARTTLLLGGMAAFGGQLAYGLTEHSTWNGQFTALFWTPLALVACALPSARSAFAQAENKSKQKEPLFRRRPWAVGLTSLGLFVLLVGPAWTLVQLNQAGLEKLKIWQGTGGDLATAIRLYREAQGLAAWTNIPARGLAWLYWHDNQPEQAKEYLQEALQRQPGDRSSLLLLGDVLEKLGQPEVALQARREAGAAPIYLNRGRQVFDSSDDRGSEPYFKQALEIDPTFWEGYQFLVLLYQRHGRTTDSINLLNQAVKYLPDDPRPVESLARLKN